VRRWSAVGLCSIHTNGVGVQINKGHHNDGVDGDANRGGGEEGGSRQKEQGEVRKADASKEK